MHVLLHVHRVSQSLGSCADISSGDENDTQPSVMHLGIKVSQWKRICSIDSFFALNGSQTESERKYTEEEQCINEEETDGAQTKPWSFQKTWFQDHTLSGYEKEAMFCYFCRKSKKTNPLASEKGCTNFRTSTLLRHNDCNEHVDAVNYETMGDTLSNTITASCFHGQSQHHFLKFLVCINFLITSNR